MKLLTLADPYVSAWAGAIQRRPKLIVFICLLVTLLIGMGLPDLKIATHYKVYFSDSNPEVLDYESFQSTYTQGDNFFFVLIPKNSTVFSERPLQLARELTRRAWQLPYACRVDSVTHFQHSQGLASCFLLVTPLLAMQRDRAPFQQPEVPSHA